MSTYKSHLRTMLPMVAIASTTLGLAEASIGLSTTGCAGFDSTSTSRSDELGEGEEGEYCTTTPGYWESTWQEEDYCDSSGEGGSGAGSACGGEGGGEGAGENAEVDSDAVAETDASVAEAGPAGGGEGEVEPTPTAADAGPVDRNPGGDKPLQRGWWKKRWKEFKEWVPPATNCIPKFPKPPKSGSGSGSGSGSPKASGQ